MEEEVCISLKLLVRVIVEYRSSAMLIHGLQGKLQDCSIHLVSHSQLCLVEPKTLVCHFLRFYVIRIDNFKDRVLFGQELVHRNLHLIKLARTHKHLRDFDELLIQISGRLAHEIIGLLHLIELLLRLVSLDY